ncbi:carbon monoxide dehydrogenase subunit G [Scopulibacillus daqui]|uniref:Carbon monoxide dehydrogenase subunit G n=1 Tax=Scopulibacillus daqui TaxID=1469162 RepID=A0ABS2Q0A3_9BACL|nr:carbon monoxide dehydrogenase subunit G [Scopulibacillus daqui]
MNINGEILVEAPQEKVWQALNDPEVLKKATPGCQSLIEVAPDHYKAHIVLGIPAVRGRYDADIKILEKSPPDQYRLIMNANSTKGFVQGDTTVKLTYQAPNTVIRYEGDAKAGGFIAGVGKTILSGISKIFIKDFFKKIAKHVKSQ